MKAQVQRLAGMLAVSVAVASVVVQTAAAERRDDRPGLLGVGAADATAAPDWAERAIARQVDAQSVPDWFERTVEGTVGTGPARPDDLGGARGPGVLDVDSTPVASDEGRGFEWSDAATGAGFALALVAVILATTVALRRRPILR